MPTTDDESVLVEHLRGGDRAAYDYLLRHYAPGLLQVAERIVGGAADAQDAVQDAFITAWCNLARFDHQARFSTWLHRITVNAALAILRRRARHSQLPSHEHVYVPHDDQERAQWIWRAIDTLPKELRTVLVLRDVEELTSKEVAALLSISDALVRQRLHRARKKVASLLRPELVGQEPLEFGGGLVETQLKSPHMRQLFAHLRVTSPRPRPSWWYGSRNST